MNIKQHRERNNLSQEQLARELNVDRSAVAKWETGKAIPSTDKLPKLAEIFGCTIDELFGVEQERLLRKEVV